MSPDDGRSAPDLADLLVAAGLTEAEVDKAATDGTLVLLAIEEVLIDEPPTLDLAEVSALSGLTQDQIRSYWRALGYPDPRSGEKVFSATSLELLRTVVDHIDKGAIDHDVALQLARVIGTSLERIASALVDAVMSGSSAYADVVADRAQDAAGPDEAASGTGSGLTSGEALTVGAELLGSVPRILEIGWRRHLADAARRRRLRAAGGEGDRLAVGFADLVGFTAQTLQLTEAELAEVVARFESIAYDVVSAHGGRVVKTIGDEVMFCTDSTHQGAELALDMAARYRDDDQLSDVRVGMACGSVLERDGDLYGQVVNMASRITAVAYPGSVVVSGEVVDALSDDDTFAFRSIRSHYLKDIGRVRLWTLRRTDDQDELAYARAREQRAARRDFLLGRRADRIRSLHSRTAEAEQSVPPIFDEEPLLGGDTPTEELDALEVAVLQADLSEDQQVELLADLEAAKRLGDLEREAQARAEEADLEAERRLDRIEAEVMRKVTEAEREARHKVEEAMRQAEEEAARANDEATRKVRKVARDVERKADEVEREATRVAKRKAAEGKRGKKKR